MAILQFNAATVTPDTGAQDAIPAGWYNAAIDESEMKPTKDGAGAYLNLRFNVVDGQYQGRKVFTRLNLQNANAMAVEIAYRQLSAICHATGVMQVNDSSELHNRPLKIRVKLRGASAEYEASNEISAFKNINEVVDAPAAASASPFAAPAIPPGGAFTPPANQQPWATPPAAGAPAAPAVAPPPVAAPAPAPAPAWTAAPTPAAKQMTAMANGATYETFVAKGWTDEQLIAQGYMLAPAPSSPSAPAAPAAPSAPVPAAVANAGAIVPPWQQPK